MHLTKLRTTGLKHREGLYYCGNAKKASGNLETSPDWATVTAAGSVTSWEPADGPSSWQQQLCRLQPESFGLQYKPCEMLKASWVMQSILAPCWLQQRRWHVAPGSARSVPEKPQLVLSVWIGSPPSAWQSAHRHGVCRLLPDTTGAQCVGAINPSNMYKHKKISFCQWILLYTHTQKPHQWILKPEPALPKI